MTRRVCLLGVLLAVVPAAPAAAARAERGQFSISPARREVVAKPPVKLSSTIVGNSTARDYAVDVFPVLLRPTPAGPFTFSEQPGALRDAANVLSVTPRRFVLRAHSRRRVRLRWELMPEGRHALSVGVVFQGTPAGQAGQALRTITRILSLNFLGDGHGTAARGFGVSLTARPDPGRPRRLLLVTRVGNRGGTVATPACRPLLRVRDAHGRIVRRVRWRGDVVVPGAQREFAVPVPGVLPAGTYRAAARMCLGRTRHLRVTGRFRLVGRGILPSPALTLRAFNATGSPGGTAHARGTFVSTGTEPASSAVVVRLYRRRGAQVVGPALKTVRTTVRALAPRARAPLDVGLGTVQAGEYRAVVTFTSAPGAHATQTSDFRPLRGRSTVDRVWDWVRDHLGWLVAALLALLLLATRRRRRDDRD